MLWFNIAHYAIRPWPWIRHRPRRDRSVSRAEASRNRLHDGAERAPAAPVSRHRDCRISGGVHVDHRHAVELGRVVSGLGFLPPLRRTKARPSSTTCRFRACAPCCWSSRRRGCRCNSARSLRAGKLCLQIGAGTGAVYILRWYWWRINAWSEISAMACSLLVTVVLNRWQPFTGNSSLVFAKGALTTTVVTTIVWVSVTFLTKPEPDDVLLRFYRHVRPDVRGWKPHRGARSGCRCSIATRQQCLARGRLGCVMVYMCLFGPASCLLHQTDSRSAAVWLLRHASRCGCCIARSTAISNVEPRRDQVMALAKNVPTQWYPSRSKKNGGALAPPSDRGDIA